VRRQSDLDNERAYRHRRADQPSTVNRPTINPIGRRYDSTNPPLQSLVQPCAAAWADLPRARGHPPARDQKHRCQRHRHDSPGGQFSHRPVGHKGDTGATGPQGPTGAPGPQGPPGQDGVGGLVSGALVAAASPTAAGYTFTGLSFPLDVWAVKAPMPTARRALAAAEVGGKIYAIGGEGSRGRLQVVEEYDPVSNTWTTKAP